MTLTTNFITLREEWNRYKLENGTILKSKTALGGIEIDQDSKMGSIQLSPVSPVIVPVAEDRGTPSTDQSLKPEDILGTVGFEKISEVIDAYDIPEKKFLLLIKSHLMRIVKPSLTLMVIEYTGLTSLLPSLMLDIHLTRHHLSYPPSKLSDDG